MRVEVVFVVATHVIAQAKLVARFDEFAAGQWNDLINEGV